MPLLIYISSRKVCKRMRGVVDYNEKRKICEYRVTRSFRMCASLLCTYKRVWRNFPCWLVFHPFPLCLVSNHVPWILL